MKKTNGAKQTKPGSSAPVRGILAMGAAVLAVLALAGPVRADGVPTLLPVQGLLTDADGRPVNGAHDISLLLYESEDGATPIHSETHSHVEVAGGSFTASLGAGVPAGEALTLDRFQQSFLLWLEVVIDGTEVITPRFQLGTVPYAAVAANATHSAEANHALVCDSATDAATLAGKEPSAYTYGAGPGLALDGGRFSIADGSVTGAMLAPGLTYPGQLTVERPSGTTLSLKDASRSIDFTTNSIDTFPLTPLHLNNNSKSAVVTGGDLTVLGAAVLGYVQLTCDDATACACPTGTRPIGGGGFDPSGLRSSAPSAGGWIASCQTSNLHCVEVYVICARVK